jgi:hypothetical protein
VVVTATIFNVANILEENVMLPDLLDKSQTAYVEMKEQQYRAERELADRYRSFVTEMLRLSLAGLAAFSFIYKQSSPVAQTINAQVNYCWVLWGLRMFALSAACALLFLYLASEGLRWYIAGLRYYLQPQEAQVAEGQAASGEGRSADVYLAERMKWIRLCRYSKGLAAITLALGGIFMAFAIIPRS